MSRMTTQLELRGEAYSRRTDPITSLIAAKSIEGAEASRMEQLVLSAIKSSNGLTNHEIVSATGLPWNSCTPRVRPLVRKGLVIDSGLRRPGPAGKKCIVWRAI